jgi:hypothetical protein
LGGGRPAPAAQPEGFPRGLGGQPAPVDASGRVFINSIAARDLAFWRALIRVALVHPRILGCPIDLLRTTRLPDWFIVSDACTTTGGGSWLSPTPEWLPGQDNQWLAMRWTTEELIAIQARLLCYPQPTRPELDDLRPHYEAYEVPDDSPTPRRARAVTINVLEFTQAVFTIMVFAPILRNCVVDFGTDNTATLCWLVRNRSSPGAADTLLKLLSLTCTIYNIKLVVHHVPGKVNIISDWISRVLGVEFADPHDVFLDIDVSASIPFLSTIYTRLRDRAKPLDKQQVCRLLISHALRCEEDLSAAAIIQMMESLHHLESVTCCTDDRIPTVIDSYQRAFSGQSPPPPIPTDLTSAVTAALEWDSLPPSSTFRR